MLLGVLLFMAILHRIDKLRPLRSKQEVSRRVNAASQDEQKGVLSTLKRRSDAHKLEMLLKKYCPQPFPPPIKHVHLPGSHDKITTLKCLEFLSETGLHPHN